MHSWRGETDPWGFLVCLPCLLSEFQANEKLVQKKNKVNIT